MARAALVDDEADRDTGRGLAIVSQLAETWGVDATDVDGRPGKLVWAELVAGTDDARLEPTPARQEAVLIDVPIRLYLASEAQLDALLREMQLLAADWSSRDDRLVRSLAESLRRNAEARIVSQAEARRRIEAGDDVLVLRFPMSAATPSAARGFLDVVDLSETLTRRGDGTDDDARLTAELRHFRRWYVAELTHQALGGAPRPCPFRP
jgi:hypothetical protein